MHHQPKTGLEAKFSAEYWAAITLLRGRLGLREVTDEAVAAPEVQALVKMVTVYPDPSITVSQAHVKIKVLLKNGATHTEAYYPAKGAADNPLTRAELDAKFHECAQWGGVSRERAARAIELVRGLERLDHCAELVRCLGSKPGADAIDRGLIHGLGDERQIRLKLGLGDDACGMARAVEAANLLGQRRLVLGAVAELAEGDGDGLEVALAGVPHQADERTGVDAGRQEGANGHIGPLAVTRRDILRDAFATALKLAANGSATTISAFLPGTCDGALSLAVSQGMRITFPMLLMASPGYGDWTQYLPRNPGFM